MGNQPQDDDTLHISMLLVKSTCIPVYSCQVWKGLAKQCTLLQWHTSFSMLQTENSKSRSLVCSTTHVMCSWHKLAEKKKPKYSELEHILVIWALTHIIMAHSSTSTVCPSLDLNLLEMGEFTTSATSGATLQNKARMEAGDEHTWITPLRISQLLLWTWNDKKILFLDNFTW